MVKIFNIKIENRIISCDLIPESCKESCRMIYNMDTKETECTLPAGYEYCTMHVSMARHWLLENIDKEMPKEKLLMWY